MTDLPVKVARASWYSYRSWIERGFRQNKRGGWHWEQSRHLEASRAERVWLTFAVATLWSSGIGGEAEEALAVQPPLKQEQSRQHKAPPRRLGCFMRGVLVLRDYLGSRRPYPPLQFIPEERQEKGQCQPYFLEDEDQRAVDFLAIKTYP